MEIRDTLYGAITLESHELPILDSVFFQRLRQIRQLGFAENSFPNATHTRFIHSLGTLHAASLVFESLFEPSHLPSHRKDTPSLSLEARRRLKAIARLGALLHDVGHGPLSHTTELAMPPVETLNLPTWEGSEKPIRKATHEDYTLKIILDSAMTPLLEQAGRSFGFTPKHIASLIQPRIPITDDFFCENGVDYRPILTQMISSELDADRIDYLRRDSLHAGVSYGHFDFHWLVGSLTPAVQSKKCYLALQHRALYTFEDFLISRFHMFLMVYFHHKSVIYDEILGRYLTSPGCDYTIPSKIEEYCKLNDAHLYSHLTQSKSPWAQRIVDRRPYQVFIEIHSGIPNSGRKQKEQQELLGQIQSKLEEEKIHSISATSTSEFSKYFKPLSDPVGHPIFVHYDNYHSKPSFIPLEQCTDLFERYEKKRSISRLYVAPEDYEHAKKIAR